MPSPKEKRTRHGLQRQCVSCESRFTPHHRLGIRQKTCGKAPCRRKHRAGYRRKYRRTNSESEQGYEKKRREARPPDFWKKFRESHPSYVTRNRAQARFRKQLNKAGLQRQLDIVQLFDPPEKLGALMTFATSHRSLLQECGYRPAA